MRRQREYRLKWDSRLYGFTWTGLQTVTVVSVCVQQGELCSEHNELTYLKQEPCFSSVEEEFRFTPPLFFFFQMRAR